MTGKRQLKYCTFSIAICDYVIARTKDVGTRPKPAVTKVRSRTKGYHERGVGLEEWKKATGLYNYAIHLKRELQCKRSVLITINLYKKWDRHYYLLDGKHNLPNTMTQTLLRDLRDTLYWVKGYSEALKDYDLCYGANLLLGALWSWECDFKYFEEKQRRSKCLNS